MQRLTSDASIDSIAKLTCAGHLWIPLVEGSVFRVRLAAAASLDRPVVPCGGSMSCHRLEPSYSSCDRTRSEPQIIIRASCFRRTLLRTNETSVAAVHERYGSSVGGTFGARTE